MSLQGTRRRALHAAGVVAESRQLHGLHVLVPVAAMVDLQASLRNLRLEELAHATRRGCGTQTSTGKCQAGGLCPACTPSHKTATAPRKRRTKP